MIKKALIHFKINDPLLHTFAKKFEKEIKLDKEKPEDYFSSICRIIIGQQLSGGVAEVIYDRFIKLYRGNITPKSVLATPHDKLRGVGMSNAKAKYIKNIAQVVEDDSLRLIEVDFLPDYEVKKKLLRVKGIGPWTAEMFLMFTLGRPDIFSHGDLGLRKGIRKIYGFKKDPSQKTIERLIKKWSPYKSYASLVLWRSLEAV